ncbi:UDP-N-acetylglucosamine acyltransferase [Reinekea marinisedimentorum]|uniref:Acyl-[acyl-carrier-protein]--UDP-N-acetylglucosamine O-acyltransferase n=1 Tax=Reinekea marinisedimentorum TaxID=230495 RepID=A0A4V2UJP3_9GAMM|nr:acyl-ACP--UDP-N-acetylglucosamine O-acyltransferase [Reinekea marinisedimentorum]TCS40719.1 UDP-N-acetylglucosamine acyltransferase [Reinekea marinisedimentorum]
MVNWPPAQQSSVQNERLNVIHPTAIVDPSAVIAEGVEIGAYSVIGANVEIGAGTWVGPHVVINGPTVIGKNNRIFQFASVGEECQDLKYKGEPTRLIIGDGNTIREFTTLQRGTVQGEGETVLGSHGLYMAYSHVAHDCRTGDHVILANSAQVAGHCVIGNHAILGGNTGIHQFCQIGEHAFVGTGSTVLKDVPAYVTVQGFPASPYGMNVEGLKRRGFSKEAIRALRQAYKTVYREGKILKDALAELQESAAAHEEVAVFVNSIARSSRGIAR